MSGPSGDDVFEIRARIDEPPRPHAKSEFVRTARGGRALRSSVASLIQDGDEVTVTAPDGARIPGELIPPLSMMDPDLGYSPRPEDAPRLEFRHGTWLRRRN